MSTVTDPISHNVENRHDLMVLALMKQPSQLHEESTPKKWALIHASIGIAGEMCELASAEDRLHVLEEAGDALFYCRDLRLHVLEEAGDALFYCRDLRRRLHLPEFSVTVHSRTVADMVSAILDHTKRLTVYNYKMDGDRLSRIMMLLNDIESEVARILRKRGFTREQALEANIEKLLTGPNARYKEGYSDLAAQVRADKTREEDDV